MKKLFALVIMGLLSCACVNESSRSNSGSDDMAAGGAAGGGPVNVDSVTPNLTEDFSGYDSTAQFLADPHNFYAASEDGNTARMSIDTSVGHNDLTQSLRYDYPAGTSTDYTITRSISTPAVSEIWVEAAVRWSTDFTILGNGQPAGPAQKLLHIGINGGPAGRFGLNLEGASLRAEGPNDNYDDLYFYSSVSTSDLFDGEWHVLRYHIRIGSQDFHELWVDGVHQGSATGNTAATSLSNIALAKNLNMLADRNMSMWWGQVKYWDQDPGWE